MIRKLSLSDNQTPFWGWKRSENQGLLQVKPDGLECDPYWIPFSAISSATLHEPKDLPFSFGWRVLRIKTSDAIYDISGNHLNPETLALPFQVGMVKSGILPKTHVVLLAVILVIVVLVSVVVRSSS